MRVLVDVYVMALMHFTIVACPVLPHSFLLISLYQWKLTLTKHIMAINDVSISIVIELDEIILGTQFSFSLDWR